MPIPRLAKSAAFAIVALAATQITFAQTQPDMTPADPGMMGKQHEGPSCNQKVDWEAKHTKMQNKFAQDLSLTPKQKTKIDAMHKAYYDSHKSVFDAQKARFDELCKMKASGASDAEIHAKMQSMPKTDFETMKKDKEKLDAQIRAELTPEQAKKFDEMKAAHAKQWQEKKQSIGKSHWSKPGEQQPMPPTKTMP
jgi:Spy/CpxP family protein refolding chaperone